MVVRRWPLRIESGRSLSNQFLHLRLVIESLHLRRRAHQVQVDAALRLRREMRQAGQTADRSAAARALAEQRRERQRADALRAREEAPASFLRRHLRAIASSACCPRCDTMRLASSRVLRASSDRLRRAVGSQFICSNLVEIQQLVGQHRQGGHIPPRGSDGIAACDSPIVQQLAGLLGLRVVVAREIRRKRARAIARSFAG